MKAALRWEVALWCSLLLMSCALATQLGTHVSPAPIPLRTGTPSTPANTAPPNGMTPLRSMPAFTATAAITTSQDTYYLPEVIATLSLPRPDHVVVVILENHSYWEIIGNNCCPYLN